MQQHHVGYRLRDLDNHEGGDEVVPEESTNVNEILRDTMGIFLEVAVGIALTFFILVCVVVSKVTAHNAVGK